jgi:hypothetical protein
MALITERDFCSHGRYFRAKILVTSPVVVDMNIPQSVVQRADVIEIGVIGLIGCLERRQEIDQSGAIWNRSPIILLSQ